MVVDCRVEQIQRFFLQVHVGPHVRGRIHVTEVTNEIPKEAKGKAEKGKAVEKLKDDQVLELQKGDATHPFRKFKVGDVVKARVLHVDEVAARHRQLAITHQQVVSRNVVFLTLKTEELAKGAAAPSPRPSMHSLVVGQRVSVCVQEVGRTTIWALLGPNVRGKISICILFSFFLFVQISLHIFPTFDKNYLPVFPVVKVACKLSMPRVIWLR